MNWEEIERAIKNKAPTITRDILKAAADSHNEAEFRGRVSHIFNTFSQEVDIPLQMREEYTLASGSADAVFNRLVIEYKKPGTLHRNPSYRKNQESIEQIKSYIKELAGKEGHDINRLAGAILDGHYFIFLRRYDQSWHIQEPVEVNRYSVQHFLKLFTSLRSGLPLTSQNLIEDFGTGQPRCQNLIRAIQDAYQKTANPLVPKLFEQWKMQFSEVIEYKDAFSSPKLRELSKFAKKTGVELKDTELFFFSIHTYFALLVKLLAWSALSRYVSPAFASPSFGKLVTLSSEELKGELTKMEAGGIFREFGIRNLLEGDFFSWYLHAWDEDLDEGLRGILERLDNYDPTTLEVNPEETRDLLKKLYHYLMPGEIRHNLGEYYTPDWLAQRLLLTFCILFYLVLYIDGRTVNLLFLSVCSMADFL